MNLNKKEIFKRLCYNDDIIGLINECKKQDLVKSEGQLNAEYLINNGELWNRGNEAPEKQGKVTFDLIMGLEKTDNFKAIVLLKDYPSGIQTTVCNHCKKEIDKQDFDIAIGYWLPIFRAVHKECKKQAEEIEAKECQTIDANCNDCKYFKRNIPAVKEEIPKDNQISDNIFPPVEGFKGFCEKYNTEVFANCKTATGMGCFVHRKD